MFVPHNSLIFIVIEKRVYLKTLTCSLKWHGKNCCLVGSFYLYHCIYSTPNLILFSLSFSYFSLLNIMFNLRRKDDGRDLLHSINLNDILIIELYYLSLVQPSPFSNIENHIHLCLQIIYYRFVKFNSTIFCINIFQSPLSGSKIKMLIYLYNAL